MKPITPLLNTLWGGLIVEELRRAGVDCFVFSSGSRSTPFAVALGVNNRIDPVFHLDERAAAYHALGHARATGSPAAVFCTSGTAAANMMPAVIEADQEHVPLIIVSADRPPELHDTGANQSVDQVKLYGTTVRWHIHLPCPTLDIPPQTVLTAADQAVCRALSAPAGPVHINAMFREPFISEQATELTIGSTIRALADACADNDPPSQWSPIRHWLKRSTRPWVETAVPERRINRRLCRRAVAAINGADDGVLIIGRLTTNAERDAVNKLASTLKWPVLPDITSGMRLGNRRGEYVPYYDQLLAADAFTSPQSPGCVVHIGGRTTSKRLDQWLAEVPPEVPMVSVKEYPERDDSLHRAAVRIDADIDVAVVQLCKVVNVRPRRSPQLHRLRAACRRADALYSKRLSRGRAPISEPGVARWISEHILAEHVLALGNSMPVRDMDMFAAASGKAVAVTANRGASGIDGTIASALGFARGLSRPLTMVVGDMALLHDLNSLALISSMPGPAIIVVINNDGGGVFSFLPIARRAELFEPLFGTPHGITFRGAATMFGLAYARPRDMKQFAKAYNDAVKAERSTLIEVRTDREKNVDLHIKLRNDLA